MLTRINRLCCESALCREACSKFTQNEKLSSSDSEDLLLCLSEFLLNPEITVIVAKIFPDILPQLMLLAIEDSDKFKDREVCASFLHRKRSLMLGRLIAFHPDALMHAVNYFHNHPAPYEDVDVKGPESKSKRLKTSKYWGDEDVSAEDIASTCLQLLRAAPEDFRSLWNWSIFMELYGNHKDHYVRWLACNCAAIVTGMCDVEKNNLVNSKVPKDEAISFAVRFDTQHARITDNLDLENCHQLDERMRHSDGSFPTLDCAVNVGELVLPKYKNTSKSKSTLVLVNSTKTNLENVALGVASGRAVCLQGPVGCGKTALVEHLADVTGRDGPPPFLKVQLGDQIDSKMLLGMYRCTDIPGEFVWQPGVLTQAVLGGHWLLLEDIDCCPTDILAVLSSLLENKQLNVPGYRDCVRCAPGFQLFLTQRLVCNGETLHRQHSTAASMLGKLWVEVQVEPLSHSELIQIVQEMYPNLVTLAPRLVDVFLLFSAGGHHSALTADSEAPEHNGELGRISRKLISTRDLLKWCARTAEDFNPTSQECELKALQNAIDIFCWSLSDPGVRLNLAKRVAAKIGIIDTKASYFCDTHKPSVSASGPYLYVGRTKLKKLEEGTVVLDRKMYNTFTFTRPASCILEKVACCVAQNEPVLLVGETGVGKTSSIQYLAQCMGQKLVVINMNQQSDSADLLGGYKPVELKYVIAPIREKFETLFRSLFDVEENAKFLGHIASCVSKGKWQILISLMKHSCSAALKRLNNKPKQTPRSKKRRKRILDSDNEGDQDDKSFESVLKSWIEMSEKVHHLECQLKNTGSPVAFSFVEGSLVRALREGYWVLLDEINLATAETLQCLSGLLEGSSGSLSLLERGDRDALLRHSHFRLFAAMNPATNVGKRELPSGIRNRFTEFFVDELTDKQDLLLLCNKYLSPLALPASLLDSVVRFYVNIRKEASKTLMDGVGDRPHYSLRTFCRALQVAASNPCQAARRSLFEGLLMSFLTQLDGNSRPIVEKLLTSALVGKGGEDVKSLLHCPLSDVKQTQKCVIIEGYPVVQGIEEPKVPDKYILTPTVRRNLKDLVRVVSLARLPVLLQGETSVGKTSLIKYLAESSGNRCVRINNHEHTDLQEYIGCYAADENGKLTFKEGVLVEAMRKGYWIILDELNLAPSDVLEALNRVLDDNRELFVTETQETIKAHPNFMLFGTQNPPGRYGGRKVLSRAFRNRFVEFHLEDIPQAELETILHQRCDLPLSYCKKLVAVMYDLQRHRTNSAAFAGKEGFITLRDLFRWGERYRLADSRQTPGKFYDWDQHIADEGYLLLAGRVRLEEERKVIIEILQKHIKRNVSTQKLFTLNEETSTVTRHILENFLNKTPSDFRHLVWTSNMRQLAVLLGKACEFKEPVLLVGETGCGKTTICQYLAASLNKHLNIVNCHMHSESADFLGGLRPVRDHSGDSLKLFEWVDGPLIKSMLEGGLFLADEISLAEDSVLERLNSLLEPERTLLLAEKGTGADGQSEEIKAAEGFHFIGTMNPGGDYGKKELSPALRNRFTEIWCEPCLERDDLVAVVRHNLASSLKFGDTSIAPVLVDFLEWFGSTELSKKVLVSMRDVLTWVNFINVSTRPDVGLSVDQAYIHGACLTFLDSFGSGLTSAINSSSLVELRSSVLKYLVDQVKSVVPTSGDFENEIFGHTQIVGGRFGVKPFFIDMGEDAVPTGDDFHFSAPTTHSNLTRLLRGMQLAKALLLEGSPGVGKTSLVTALARASGHRLVRINLSDQTDVSDLFGADLPVEGGSGGEFAWRDGPFLQALRAGHWILLDELNLASQSVLEGLNAVLDHRGDLFIPELGQTFHIRSGQTRIFGCQNPLSQGGARKGLPKSFLNRFTQVYMDTLTDADLEFICASQFPQIPKAVICRMVAFNGRVARETGPAGNWGSRGAPWEFNLRDITRWCQATLKGSVNRKLNPGRFVHLIYVDRMRTLEDKETMKNLYEEIFGDEWPLTKDQPVLHVTPDKVFIGDVALNRVAETGEASYGSSLFVLQGQLRALQSIAWCVSLNWMSILVGYSGCGKSSVVRLLAQLTGKELRTLSVNSAMDTTEILGGFEQVDYTRHLDEITGKVERLLLTAVRRLLLTNKREKDVEKLLALLANGRAQLRETRDKEEPARKFEVLTKILNEIIATIPKEVLPEDVAAEISVLKTRLDTVTQNVLKDESLNAGGRFEWIDSVLVKSLVDGCWLLVDNVNLCSATVLDRLNGLLEPQGVLTIGERGVGANGELVTITPHPDFRLFLTMDSRHGEISRAMRNRGVEIYLLDPDDAEDNLLDRAALLNYVGLTDARQQSALVGVHEVMATAISGPDAPGMTELLQTASLVAQAQQHGVNVQDAFLNACKSVYIRSRISDTPAARRELLTVLEDAFKATEQTFKNDLSVVSRLCSFGRVNTADLWMDSILAEMKQRCAVLLALSEGSKTELRKVDEVLDCVSGDKVADIRRQLMFVFYAMCSSAELPICHKWLSEMIRDESLLRLSAALSECLKAVYLPASDLPWDLRWLPDVAEKNPGEINRIAALLLFTAVNTLEGIDKAVQKSYSIMKYSEAVSSQKLTDDLTSERVIIGVAPLLKEIDKTLWKLLKSSKVQLSREQWSLLRSALLWRCRLWNYADSTYLSSDPNALEDVVRMTRVYVRWILKKTVSPIKELASNADVKSLNKIAQDISSFVQYEGSSLNRLVKNMRARGVYPQPYFSEHQVTSFEEASSLNKVLGFWEVGKSNIATDILFKKILLVLSPNGVQAWETLTDAYFLLCSNGDSASIRDNLESAKMLLSEVQVPSSEDPDVSLPKVDLNECDQWPLLEFVTLRLAAALRASLSSKSESSERLAHNLFSMFARLKTCPPVLGGGVKYLSQSDWSKEVFLPWKVREELALLLQYETNVPTLQCPFLWIALSNDPLAVVNSDKEPDAQPEENLPLHCPVLSRSVGALLFSNNSDLSDPTVTIPLKDHERHRTKLNQMQSILWRNSAALSQPEFNYLKNEAVCAINLLQDLVSRVETSLNIPPLEIPLKSRVETLCGRLLSLDSSEDVKEFTNALAEAALVAEELSRTDRDLIRFVGEVWVLIGALETRMFISLGFVDPAFKQALKLSNIEEEILETEKELHAYTLTMKVKGLPSDEMSTTLHPHVAELYSNLKRLEEKRAKLLKGCVTPQRPEVSLFNLLSREIKNYGTSIGSFSTIQNLSKRAVLAHRVSDQTAQENSTLLQELSTWDQSQCRFERILTERFAKWYPDMVNPLIGASIYLRHGMSLLRDSLFKAQNSSNFQDLETTIREFVQFPRVSPLNSLSLVHRLTSASSARLLEISATEKDESELKRCIIEPKKELYRLLKSALMEVNNVVVSTGSLGGENSEEWKLLQEILRQFVLIWQKQEEERRVKELQEESLYKSGGASRGETLTEEEEIAQGLAQSFPSQREEDFGDIETPTALEDATSPPTKTSEELTGMLTKEDAAQLCRIHASLVLRYTDSLSMRAAKGGSVDFISPWLERSSVAVRLLNVHCRLMDGSTDEELCSSLALATAAVLDAQRPVESQRMTSKSKTANYDFYHDAYVDEVQQCAVVLKQVEERVEQLREEWPEHPTLKTILVVADRVKGFSLSSPVSRFLTGLEILLGKLQEWEENAHKGVSLGVYSKAVTELIFQWRRLELTCWKGCLDATARRMENAASRWWFHLYSLVDGYVSGSISTPKDLLTSLERFMEEAPLGEFHARLQLLLAFHCHSLHLKTSVRQSELAAMLWNLHSFYSLFSDAVKAKINELRSPIEKKIKGYVKIARWNDISFWAVKEAVHKTHQTLHKQIREFEKVLNQPSRPALVTPTSEAVVERTKKKELNQDVTAFIAKSSLKQLIPAELQDAVSTSGISHSPSSLFGRARTLTKQAISAWTCPDRIRSVDAFAGEIASTAQYLSSLQVDRTLERKKQVSHAKNIVQMKRKNLADLFRNLQNIGLSYRTGLGFDENDTVYRFSLLHPLDLEVAFRNCVPSFLPAKNADECVVSAGHGAESYIVRSLARRVHLTTSLRQPHSDVGPTLIQRLRGFASHLMELNYKQKQSLVDSCKLLLRSRVLIGQLAGLTRPIGLSQENLSVFSEKLNQALQTAAFTLRQFLMLLQACPDNAELVTTWELSSESSPITYAVSGDACWANTNAQIKSLLFRIENILKALRGFELCAAVDVKRVVTDQECSAIRHSFDEAGATVDELKKICSSFGNSPVTRSLESVQVQLSSLVEEFKRVSSEESVLQTERNDVTVCCDPVLRLVLLAVQDIVKERKQDVAEDKENIEVSETQTNEIVTNGVEETAEVADEGIVPEYKLVDKHLTEGVVGSLENNLAQLRMKEVCREVGRLLKRLTLTEFTVKQDALNQVAACVPLLHQWALLCQSVVQQQAAALRASAKLLSVLLSVFNSVAQKGFCMPEDLKGEEQKDEEGEDNRAGGMGLGDGEGEKDVSEKIESEDQLEGAYQEGEEKKEDDKDLKEEEKAIEMSDDFEGKHQDVEPKEGSDDEEDEDDDDDIDPEQEMGDTGEGAEELDEQIWGSDPEDEENEDLEGDDRKNSGEQIGEKELGASEDQDKMKGEDDEEDENRPQDKKKEINEMQEPEVDDDHVDPYHGKQKPEEEPEPMDLPDDLQMDEGEKDEGENEAENPFDVDALKDEIPPEPEKMDETAENNGTEENKEDENGDDSEGEGEGGERDNAEADDEEKVEEDPKQEEGGAKDEEKGGDDPAEDLEEEEAEIAEQAKPSSDDVTAEAAEKAEAMDTGSKDQVDTEKQETADIEPEEERDDAGDPGKNEQKGVGKADTSEVQQGHQSDQSGKQPRPDRTKEELSDQKKKQRPGHSDEKRTLGDMNEPAKKKLKTVDSKEQKEEKDVEEEEKEPALGRDDADMYEHIQEAKEEGDTQTLDAATKEQAEQQPRIAKEEEEATPPDEDVPMDVDDDEEDLKDETLEKQKPEQVTESKKKEKSQKLPAGEERLENEVNHEIDGDIVETSGVSRGPETTFHTRIEELSIRPVADVERDMQTLRIEIQNQMATWRQPPIGPEAEKTWQTMSSVVGSLAHDLCEQLRLIMEPTQASRLRGDFRTGRRLNMRKVIPYIASQYRKDKIWLRRTKPSKREYQIVLAIDDSSSMADNQSKELAFESVALVSKALTLLEAGELGVLSFGDTPRLVHRLGEPFTQQSGGRLLQEFTFEQHRTQIAALLNYATEMLSGSRSISAEHAQLLVIVSDGRGIFSEGKEIVKAAVQRTRQAGVFVLFLVIDNPKNKDSIFDIRVPEFVGGKLMGITPYMDSFPFPFYLILQDLASLPRVLSNALRQWFELVSKTD